MLPIENVRNENIIFEELKQLCQQPGYAHVVASFVLEIILFFPVLTR